MATNQTGLKDPGLFKTLAYIGEWCASSTGRTYQVVNPATGENLAELPDMGADEALKAVNLATETFPVWSSLTVDERSQILKKWAQLMREHKDDLGRSNSITRCGALKSWLSKRPA